MAKVTFQVIDGVDKGRVFRDLPTPVTVGREEGNSIRLNDERISRFHAKVQQDQDDLILTDLDSTNGTRVNGQIVQIHRLRHGDYVLLGRSVLLFGSMEEIAQRQAELNQNAAGGGGPGGTLFGLGVLDRPTVMAAKDVQAAEDADIQFKLAERDPVTSTPSALRIGKFEFPPLPQKLSPSQSARLAEILNFLHRAIGQLIPHAHANEDGTQITLDYATWQKILQVEMLLARYYRTISEPDEWLD